MGKYSKRVLLYFVVKNHAEKYPDCKNIYILTQDIEIYCSFIIPYVQSFDTKTTHIIQ